MQLTDYAQALGAAQRLVPSYAGQQRDAADLQAQQLQNRQAQQQIAAVDAQDQEHRAFQSAFTDLGDNPSADKLRMLGVRFPSLSKGLNEAVAGMEKGQRQQIVSDTAQIHAALTANRPDLAKSLVQRHIDADKAAGKEPDPEDTALIGMIDSGDKQQISAAKGMLYATLAAADPDSAAKTIGEYGAGANGKTHVITPGGALVDDAGKELYRAAPAEDNALQVPVYDDQGHRIGTKLIANGGKGGDPSSTGTGAAVGSGSPVAGRTQFGWTPRARNGGDNTDAAVDGKIAGMASHLGLSPTDPFPASMTNRQVYEAITLSEGGRGSLADTNNNRGNLRDPKTLAYRKFGDKNAGDAAGIAQVARNRARGQNTIQTMVEGLPVSGSRGRAASAGDGSYVGPVSTKAGTGAADDATVGPAYLAKLSPGRRNLIQAIAEGRAAPPRPGSKFGEALAEDIARAYPDVDATQFAGRQQAVKAFATGKEAATVRSLNVAIDHLGVLHDAAIALNSGNIPLFNRLNQRWQRATGSPLPQNATAVAGIVGDEVTKAVIGSAGALADRQELKHTLDTAGSPAQIAGITRQYISLMAGQAKGLQLQYEQSTGKKDFVRFLSPTTAKQLGLKHGQDSNASPAAPPPGGKHIGMYHGKPVYLLPDGRKVVAR